MTENKKSIDVVPKFEISLEENKQRLQAMQKFIKDQMIEGTDYGTIPGIKKPTLFKSGAEKIANIYGFNHQFQPLQSIEDFDKGLFFYRYKCKIYHKGSGVPQAEGIGSCNNREKKYVEQDPYTLLNTIDKMAQKRAYVAAVLSACRVSNAFTQDVEDTSTSPTYTCESCDKTISQDVADYSQRFHNKKLCRTCQKGE